jgi:hypothetical protein
MSNHFHLLMGVPKKPDVMPSNAELIETVRASLGDLAATNLEYDLEQAEKIKSVKWEEEIRERYLRRMWDVSSFMKTLKQRFTQWFNRRHKRKGTLWEDRFRSVLVQSAGEPLAAMHASTAKQSVEAKPDAVLLKRTSVEVLEAYRMLLYGRGEERGVAEDGSALKKGFTREESQQVVAEGGRLPKVVYLRCRVRYFTDGAVIGSRSFVNEIFTTLKDRFGAKRKTGARLMRGLEKEDKLYALRDLKQGVVG